MTIQLKLATNQDLPFLEQMLFQAVYWRAIANGNAPSFNEGLKSSGVYSALKQFGERRGDTALIAIEGKQQVAAASYRFYPKDNSIRGYLNDETPTLWLAVDEAFRGQGIATALLKELLKVARNKGVAKISLMVSNDNVAKGLYEKCGFVVQSDDGDSSLMIRDL